MTSFPEENLRWMGVRAIGLCALLVSGCSAETDAQRDGYEIANKIVATDLESGGTNAGPPLELASADCTVKVTIDEYGFESETITCAASPDDGHATPTDAEEAKPLSAADLLAAPGWLDVAYYQTLVGSLPDDDLQAAMTELGLKLDQLEVNCGVDERRWLEALDGYIVSAEATIQTVTQERLGSYQGSIEAKALSRSLVERALMESGCAKPEPVLATSEEEAVSRTSRAVQVTVGIDNTLRGSGYGPLFHVYSTLPNYLWMRNEQVAIDTVFLGTSQLGAAVDVVEVNRELTTEVGSAWIPGALAEVQALWVDEVTTYSDPRTVVWFVGPLDLFAECDTSNRGAEFQRLAEARSAAFARGFVASPDPIDRILGRPRPELTGRGDAMKREGFDAEGTAAQRGQYVPVFAEGLFCHERAEIISETIARLKADGRAVLVVGMPVHPELRQVRPDTAAKMAMFDEQYLIDTTLLDLTATVAEEELWSDFTHLTAAGADVFTKLVIEALQGVGVQ